MSDRCPSTHPDTAARCFHTTLEHTIHAAWLRGGERAEWRDVPPGPATWEEIAGAAKELSDLLGIQVHYDPERERFVLSKIEVARWWNNMRFMDRARIAELGRG